MHGKILTKEIQNRLCNNKLFLSVNKVNIPRLEKSDSETC